MPSGSRRGGDSFDTPCAHPALRSQPRARDLRPAAGCPSRGGGSTPRRTARTVCSAAWASPSCPPRAVWSPAARPRSWASAARCSATCRGSMSRIGKKPIPIPSGVEVEISPGSVAVKGPRAVSQERINPEITVAQEDGALTVSRPTDRADHRALHGLTRSLVANMVTGVTCMSHSRYGVAIGANGVYTINIDGRTPLHPRGKWTSLPPPTSRSKCLLAVKASRHTSRRLSSLEYGRRTAPARGRIISLAFDTPPGSLPVLRLLEI